MSTNETTQPVSPDPQEAVKDVLAGVDGATVAATLVK
jgi:hypothetical protein